MLRHLGESDAAWRIRNAIEKVYRDKSKRTRDVGGTADTSQFADAIIEAMEPEPQSAAPEPVVRQA
jgi:isocitrate dehydrogenase (NAD+)